MKGSNLNGLANGKIGISVVSKSTSNDDIIKVSLSQPHLAQLKESHRERSGSGTMYRPDILYQVSW